MAIRLLSVDVDGTITNGRNQVTQATADALRRAAAAGATSARARWCWTACRRSGI